jgi:hypothetical protein
MSTAPNRTGVRPRFLTPTTATAGYERLIVSVVHDMTIHLRSLGNTYTAPHSSAR